MARKNQQVVYLFLMYSANKYFGQYIILIQSLYLINYMMN